MIDLEYYQNSKIIIASDEVGRGPIAGPVVACSVKAKFNQDLLSNLTELGVTDSKKLTQKKRLKILEALAINCDEIEFNKVYQRQGFEFILIEYTNVQIDEINILQASLMAMRDGTEQLMESGKTTVLIDGNKAFPWSKTFKENNDMAQVELAPIVKGDSKSLLIGLASIIAKEYRDQLMEKYDQQYPGYGLAKHAGYPTKAHKEAVATLGVTPIHRKSFKGVAEHVQSRPSS